MKTYLSEIFSSVQGEGPYVGERHLFVRFCVCHRACVFCDTMLDRTKHVSVEKVPGSGRFALVPNPLSVEQVVGIIREIDPKKNSQHISITGGEPLLQAHYLRELFPVLVDMGYSIYLETAGDFPHELETVIEWIDVVAMDIKLSSVTKEENTFPEHWEFLQVCRQHEAEVFTKLILSAETNEAELREAVKGIRQAGGKETLVVIQPMTKAVKTDAIPTGEQVLRWQELVLEYMPHVRVIPQTHKMLEVL